MKFINYLESITGIGVYPMVSLIIFFTFFVGVTVYIMLGRKEYFETLSNLPLRATGSDSQIPKTSHYETKIEQN
jgi:cytochrome c oxidase cbb3-type subunit 4